MTIRDGSKSVDGRHQIHFRIPDADYEFLASYAMQRGDTVAAVMRQLIRAFRRQAAPASVVPQRPDMVERVETPDGPRDR